MTMQAAERVMLPDGARELCSDSRHRGSDERLGLIRDSSFGQGRVTGCALQVYSLCRSPIFEIKAGPLQQVPAAWEPLFLPCTPWHGWAQSGGN